MSEPQPRRDAERRHPHVSHEELRRQLIDADADRFRMQNALREHEARATFPVSTAPQLRRRVAVGIGTVVVTALAGGLVWQMCPSSAKADDRSSVRVATTTVTPRVIVQPARAETDRGISTPVVRRTAQRRPRSTRVIRRIVAHEAAPRSIAAGPPRPLSPGEFGRTKAGY